MTRRAGRQSRNADFILIAAKGGDTTTLSPKGCQTLEPSGQRPVNLENPLNPLNPLNLLNLLNPGAQSAPYI